MRVLGAVADFRCLGAECPATCCAGWRLPLAEGDREAWERAGAREELDAAIELRDDGGYDLVRDAETGACVHHVHSLCSVQARFGEEALPWVCATYPRLARVVAGEVEVTASLSCPETARLVVSSDRGARWVDVPPGAEKRAPSDRSDMAANDPWLVLCEQASADAIRLLTDRTTPLRARLLHVSALLLGLHERNLRKGRAPRRTAERVRAELLGERAPGEWAAAMHTFEPPIRSALTWIDATFGARYDGTYTGPLRELLADGLVDGKLKSVWRGIEAGRSWAGDDPHLGPWPALERIAVHALLHDAPLWYAELAPWVVRWMLRMALIRAVIFLHVNLPHPDDQQGWNTLCADVVRKVARSVDHGTRDEVPEAWTAPGSLQDIGGMALVASL
jgi:hypothetical protein